MDSSLSFDTNQEVFCLTRTYGVNGLNERVSSQQGTVKRIYIYASVEYLLGVYDGATGQPVEELAYLGERPVATVRACTVYPIETDHLMAPQRVLDPSNTVLWSWEDREPLWGLGSHQFIRICV